MKRSLLEAFPEVKEEENDVDYELPSKIQKALPDTSSSPQRATAKAKHVIKLNDHSNIAVHHVRSEKDSHLQQPKIQINQAGIYSVSYSPEPATFVGPNGEHSHDSNGTYMLFLDPRPDLEEDDVENVSAPVSATRETQLQVAQPRITKKEGPAFPPMILSLVIPEHIANGSNPLLLPEGFTPANSLIEITCQVVDISITTSDITTSERN
jgi:hypothetical protein